MQSTFLLLKKYGMRQKAFNYDWDQIRIFIKGEIHISQQQKHSIHVRM